MTEETPAADDRARGADSTLDGGSTRRGDSTRNDDLPFDDADAPLSGIADRLARRDEGGERERSRAPDYDDLFDRENVGEIDSDTLWTKLERGALPGDVEVTEHDVREIPKRTYCHRCEHFAAPPEVACTNEGTTIVEAPSMDTFRVADCPVVREEEALEERT